MHPMIDQYRADLDALCRRYYVRTLELFGSAADGTFDADRSDLDFLLEFLPEAAARPFSGYFDLKDEMESLFRRRVDLVMPRAVRNRYLLEAINRQRTPVYAA